MDVTAVCERSGDWWAVTVPEVRGVHTQAKRLDQVPAMVRDAVSLLTGTPDGEIEVTIDARVPGVGSDAGVRWRLAELLEEQARALQSAAAAVRRAAIRDYRDAGLSVRDIGVLTGVSYQRVAQILGDGSERSGSLAPDAVAEAMRAGRGPVDIAADVLRTLERSDHARVREPRLNGVARAVRGDTP